MNFFYPKSYKYPSLLASLGQIRQKFFLEKEMKYLSVMQRFLLINYYLISNQPASKFREPIHFHTRFLPTRSLLLPT